MPKGILSTARKKIAEQAEDDALQCEARRAEASRQYQRESERSKAWRALCYQCQAPCGHISAKGWYAKGEQAFRTLATVLPEHHVHWLPGVETEAAGMPSALYVIEMLRV